MPCKAARESECGEAQTPRRDDGGGQTDASLWMSDSRGRRLGRRGENNVWMRLSSPCGVEGCLRARVPRRWPRFLCLLHYSHPRAKHKQTPENNHPKCGEEGGATLLKVSDCILGTR